MRKELFLASALAIAFSTASAAQFRTPVDSLILAQHGGETYFDRTDQIGRPLYSTLHTSAAESVVFAKTGQDYVKASSTVSTLDAGAGRQNVLTGSDSYVRTLLTPNTSTSATFNAYFAGVALLSDIRSLQDRIQEISDFDTFYYTPNDGDSYSGFALKAQTYLSFELALSDLSTNMLVGSVLASAELNRFISVFEDDDGRFVDGVDTYGFASSRVCTSSGPCTVSDELVTDNATFDRNFAFSSSLVAGHQYALTLSLSCRNYLDGDGPSISGLTSTCDAAHSGYWNGLTDVAAPNFALISDSGQNYVYSSALSPAPLVPAGAVPESSMWALMIAGFAAIGAMRRKKSRTLFVSFDGSN